MQKEKVKRFVVKVTYARKPKGKAKIRRYCYETQAECDAFIDGAEAYDRGACDIEVNEDPRWDCHKAAGI